MSDTHSPFDWSKRHDYNWLLDDGITKMRSIVEPQLPYTPSLFQLQNTARLLMGQDVLCISATGDGKSSLIYLYTLVRKGTMAVVISPTNSLEADMVSCFKSYVLYSFLVIH